MRLHKRDSMWVGIPYFFILLGIALWVRDIPDQPNTFTTTLEQLIRISKMGDPASFAKAAIDIAENGWISTANDWIFNLWPPGFILLEALIIKVLGPDASVILVLQVLAAALFAILLAQMFNLLNRFVKWPIAFLLPMMLFVFPVSRVFLLQPVGLSLGESFSIGFFLIGTLLALNSVVRNSLWYAVYAGLCLALSAYFRSQFEFILLALTGWGVLLVVVMQFTHLQNFFEAKHVKSSMKTVVLVLLVAHAATLPWRVYHLIYQGKPYWVATSSLMFQTLVANPADLERVGGGFIVEGAGNLVCRIDPATCGDTANAKRLFIKTFTEHPIEWYSLKFSVIGKYWFSSVQNWTTNGVKSTSMDIIVNGAILLLIIVSFGLLLSRKTRSHSHWILLTWFGISILSAYFLIFSVAHFEARYFYFPKIFGIFLSIIVLTIYSLPLEGSGMNVDRSKRALL